MDFLAVQKWILIGTMGFSISGEIVRANDWDTVTEPQVKWSKPAVRVCWRSGDLDSIRAEADFSVELKQLVQSTIEKEFASERTGISFVGWENCNELEKINQDFDIEILQDQFGMEGNPVISGYRKADREGYATIGEGAELESLISHHEGKITKKKGYFRRHRTSSVIYLQFNPLLGEEENTFNSFERLKFTALHEFGHAAGLRHEHVREEAKDDLNCQMMLDFEFKETLHDTTVVNGDYDPNSIMNYCWGSAMTMRGVYFTDLDSMPNLQDPTLIEKVTFTDSQTVVNPKTKKRTIKKVLIENFRIRVGLSQKDVQTLQSLYF